MTARRSKALIRSLILIAMTILALSTFATEQSRDLAAFANQQISMLERPLNDFLRHLPTSPRFDVLATSNWKGYVAGWEIKDSRLYLTSFAASTNGQTFPVASLFPGRKLPILADWYSGKVHLVWNQSLYDGGLITFGRVTALQLTNGVVIATNEFRNVREDKLKK